jgi:hypothetical protein
MKTFQQLVFKLKISVGPDTKLSNVSLNRFFDLTHAEKERANKETIFMTSHCVPNAYLAERPMKQKLVLMGIKNKIVFQLFSSRIILKLDKSKSDPARIKYFIVSLKHNRQI